MGHDKYTVEKLHPKAPSACSIFPRLIGLAESCNKASDFSKVLAALTEYAGAAGCIVWEIFYAGGPERRYFMLADYFPTDGDGHDKWHFLPEDCITGVAIKSAEMHFVADIDEAIGEKRVPQGELLKARGIRAFCAIPVSFGPRREAAVDLYWKNPEGARRRLDELSEASSIIPALQHGVLTRMGFTLLQEVERKLNDPTDPTRTLQNVLNAVVSCFNSVDAAIYLEDRLEAPELFRLRAQVWPWEKPIRQEYRKGEPGLTSWATTKARSIRFVDLAHFEEERTTQSSEGMEFRGGEDLFASVSKLFPGMPLPLSFVCAPILDGARTLGAIRCSLTSSPPHLYDETHIRILEMVAEQIGHWWGNQIALREERVANGRFKVLVDGTAAMHESAFRSLKATEKPSMKPLWEQALDLAAKISPWKDALSIRVVDGSLLRFAAVRGSRWQHDGNRQYAKRVATTYPLDGDSAGAMAIRGQKVLIDAGAGQSGHLRSELFPDAKRVIHAPILMGRQAVGVLDIRGFDQQAIPAQMEMICELLGRQLGLYQYLQEHFWKLREHEVLLSKQYEEQSQIYQDFLHQLRNPLVKASILSQLSADPERSRSVDLRQLRSHIQHAYLFANTIHYFVSLAKDERIDVSLELLRYDTIVPQLKQIAQDQQLTTAEDRRLTFAVDERSFEALRGLTVYYSDYLFLHCMFNLLDNAAKYSRSGTEISIRGRVESPSRFSISVTNEGHLIRPEDRKRMIERGYRGDRALRTTAGGRGIGLWIVHKFMLAMRGELIIAPTDARGRNTFSLVFRTGIPDSRLLQNREDHSL